MPASHIIRRSPSAAARLGTAVLLACLMVPAYAQEIPMGTWRAHISYRSIHSIAVSNSEVFAAAESGIMVLDRAEKSIRAFSKLNGLSGAGITCINYDAGTRQLIVAYADSKLDILKDNTVTTLDPLSTTPITGSKRVNHISIHNGLAYLSTDYGVLVLDLARAAIKETWRDLGPTGQTWRIAGSTWKGDSIFLATEIGVMAGDLNDNLLDFANWKRFASGDFNRAIQSIATFNNNVYAAVNGYGIYRRDDVAWTKEAFFNGGAFAFVQGSDEHLLVGTTGALSKVTGAGDVVPVTDALITNPQWAVEQGGTLWIGDSANGLVSDDGGAFARYIPNGPSTSSTFKFQYAGGVLQRLAGGYSATGTPLGNAGTRDKFRQGVWQAAPVPMADLTDVAVNETTGDTLLASFGGGVQKRDAAGAVTVYDQGNSPLTTSGGLVKITAFANSTEGVWIANYGVTNALHLLKNEGTWETFAPAVVAARYPVALAVDYYNYVWVVANPTQGGGIFVYDKESGGYEYLTEAKGSGALPSRNVRSIALDRDGLMWVGTDVGVGYFFSATDDITKPIFENRFLLQSDKVTAIAVDGGNRKWLGTERGVWLFNATGEQLIHNFTAANSPLLSDVIRGIAIDPTTGEVFFATDKGDVSFRSDATEGGVVFKKLRIFPNPVASNFAGEVGITGLAADAEVKITDASGKMIWQTRANGGTATWNVRDYNGRRAATGIYIVFAATPDGAESAVGKIAVLD